MRILAGRVLLSVLLLGSSFTGACAAQVFLFVSANTRDHMTDDAATEAMNSSEQSNFLAVATYLAGKVCPQPRIRSAEGIYAGTAENSSVITGCSSDQACYLGEMLGRYAHQKWVLVFDPSRNGGQHLFEIAIRNKHSRDVLQDLRQYGMNDATIVQDGNEIRVYVWARDGSQDGALHSLSESDHGALQDVPGTGMLIGNNSRTEAQRVFDRDVHAYEKVHRLSLSRLLRSKRLHDLGVGTASAAPSLPR